MNETMNNDMNVELEPKIAMRVSILKSMHEYIRQFSNDERAYMDWVTLGVPDCPSEYDFIDIASDDDLWFDNVKWFNKIVKSYTV